MNKEEQNLKDEVKNKVKEIVENLIDNPFEKVLLYEYFKIAEEYINNKPYNLENHLTMIGFAIETNRICNSIKDEKLRIEMEEKGQMIWDRWYEKINNVVDDFDLVKNIKKSIEEKSRN